MKLSVVIPVYNESAIIENTLHTLEVYLASHFAEYEILVVDDGSTDRTKHVVHGCSGGHIRQMGYGQNHGKGCAIRTGVLAARGDEICYTDADLAYGVEVIGAAHEQMSLEKADLVIGSRKLSENGYRDYPPLRLMASKCFSALTGALSGTKYDTQCGFKLLKTDAAQRIFSKCKTDGFAFDFEVMMLADHFGLKVSQMPVTVVNHRDSKVHVGLDSLRMLADLHRIRQRIEALDRGEE